MNSEQTTIFAFMALGLIAVLIDALIPNKPGSWKKEAATVQDVARIVGGARPAGQPRHGLKLGLLLLALLAIAFLFSLATQ